MEKIYIDPNMENDNTDHMRGKRLSSILKAPRNPLDDLGNGNELTQDITIEKRRKNSRRVSFANTINCRVFQRDLKNNTAEGTESAEDTRNDVLLNQNEEPEAVPCEITGMSTLLHAPIQASVQQTEEHDADTTIQRTSRHDVTLIFSEENEMDMTASHTAVITRDLRKSPADETEKIDITSFLAGLTPNNGKAETSKEFRFFPDPTSHSCPSDEQKEDVTTVKKINFNEFLKSLKSQEKSPPPPEGPDKENVVCDPSQGSEDVAQAAQFVYSQEPLDTCNVTKVFQGQDDGMEMTRCQVAEGHAVFLGTCEDPPQQFPPADVTEAFLDDGMDMTTSHTAKMSFPCPSVGNQSLGLKKNFPSSEPDSSVLNTVSNQHLTVQQDPQLCTDNKPVKAEDRRGAAAPRAARQEAGMVAAIPGSISSEVVFRGDKTVDFPKCDDMEITGNYTGVIYNDSTKETSSSPHKALGKPLPTNSLLAAGRHPARDDGEATKGLTPSDHRAPLSDKPGALELSLGSDGPVEKVAQDHGSASVDIGFDAYTSSVSSGFSKSRLQHRLAGSQHGEKTMIFSGEDMDLTKTCPVRGDGTDVEPTAGGLISVSCKPHVLSSRSTCPSSHEQEEMEITKCHAVVIDGQRNGTTVEAKQMHCERIPTKRQNINATEGANSLDVDKENYEVIGIDGNSKRRQIIETNPKDPEVIMADKKLGRTREYEYNHNQNIGMSKQLLNQSLQCPGVGVTSQAAAAECGELKVNTSKQTVTALAPRGSFISSGGPADCQNFGRQEKTHVLKVVNKELPTRAGSERGFSLSEAGEDVKPLCPAEGPHSRSAEEPSPASPSEPRQGPSQRPLLIEKSVVFPSGENMDLTGDCAVVLPGYNFIAALSERKAVPGYLIPDENKIMPLKGTMMPLNSQEQPVYDMQPLGAGKKMLTLSGLKPAAGEKTTIFSEDADMDITRSHTVSADKIILQHKNSNDDVFSVPGDRTCIFTYNDDMEISRFNTVEMEKSVSQGVLHVAKRTGRKSLKGTGGEKTVLFSLSDENNDMEITQSHTAAIGQEAVSENEGGFPPVPSAPPLRTVLTSSQAGRDITQASSADKITVKVVCDTPRQGKEVGQHTLPNGEATVFAVDDMEITKTHQGALEENPPRGWQPRQAAPLNATIMFTSYQADMEMTHESIRRDFCEDSPRLVRQEAGPGGRTIIFPSAEDMEMTKTHTAVLRGGIGVQGRDPAPAIPAVPADKTIMFTHEDDMDITASHTIAVNNNMEGFENQQVSQQPRVVVSSCRGETNPLHTQDPSGDHHTKPKDKPSIPSSPSSASAFPGEKGAAKFPGGTTPDSIYFASVPEETLAVQAPQDLDPPMDSSVPVSSQQDLVPPENLKSRRVPLKLPSNRPVDHSEEHGDLVSHVSIPTQPPESLVGSPEPCKAQRGQVLRDDSPQHDLGTGLGLAGANLVPVSNRESKENEGLAAGETPPRDLPINSEQMKQCLVSGSPGEQIDPALAPELSGILNVCSKLNNIRRKSAVFSVSETAFSDQLPKSSIQPEDTLRLGKNAVKEPNDLFCTQEQENTCPESGAALVDANAGLVLTDKYQGIKVPLGIFQPKLPNRRNPSVSSAQDINAKSSEKEAPVSGGSVNAVETPGTSKPSRHNFSPSKFIAEEFLPVCLEEMDSNGSVSSELMENACAEISKKTISHNEKNPFEETRTCNTKRALEQDKKDLQSPKKLKREENLDGEAFPDLQVTFGAVSQSQVEVHEAEEPPNISAKGIDYTHASTCSSLESLKADTELTVQRSVQMESQLLTDSICEDTLREKFQNGLITVGEFFTLIQVHVPIQKPRHSHVPASGAVSAPPTPADLLYSQYVYRPKLRIYEEDCRALAQKIEELKPYVDVSDQLLVNVNKSLWEVMRTSSDEELRSFGAELNKMKSCFTKESKILAHNEKEVLYSRLLQSAEEQQQKLQLRLEEMDGLLKEAENCLIALGAGGDWEELEADGSVKMVKGRSLEEELENIEAEEEELRRTLSDLEAENEQMLVQMEQLKEEEKTYQELLERCDHTEWDMTEWSEQRAVFSFLYDSVELTLGFGPPVDGDEFGEDPSRQIVSLNFESLLDEEKAPPSSCLVQRLIFQFIDSQGCWQEKCPTMHHLPQALRDISVVVSHCKGLGEEMEFLERWGGKYNLLKTDIDGTRVKLLFSSSPAHAKFELTLSLSATYPALPLPFTVHTHIGNIGEKEVSAVLSEVPVGCRYLRRIVTSIHQNLLQKPS